MMTLPRVEVLKVSEIPRQHKEGIGRFRCPTLPSALYSCAEQRARLKNENGGNVTRPRAADDFAAIRARMEELRRENALVPADHDGSARSRPQSTGDKPALPLAIRRSLFPVKTE
jgi:hypothetical protein